jgi:hypothetical protein
MATLQEQHIRTLDAILGREISGTFFLRNELQEFMGNEEITELLKRIDVLYERGVTKNHGRKFNPKYKFHRLVDADTVHPKIVFQVLIPGDHFHNAEVIGDVFLNVTRGEHGEVTFSLPEETEAEKLARENKWKVGKEELAALDAVITAARALQALGNRNFPVNVQVDSSGLSLSAFYNDPMKAVRMALAN